MTHFKLTSEEIKLNNITLYRIELTKKCKWGNIGDKGGFVEKKSNLNGDAWVSGDAWVYGNAEVSGNAKVSGDAWVYGNAKVSGDAQVSGKLKLTLGFFFGYKEKAQELSFFDIDNNYQLIGKGDCKVETEDSKKTELLKKAEELIQRAQELKDEANKL